MRDEEPHIHPVDGRGDPTTEAGRREQERSWRRYQEWRDSCLGSRREGPRGDQYPADQSHRD